MTGKGKPPDGEVWRVALEDASMTLHWRAGTLAAAPLRHPGDKPEMLKVMRAAADMLSDLAKLPKEKFLEWQAYTRKLCD